MSTDHDTKTEDRSDARAAPLDPHRDGGFDPQPDVLRPSHAERARTLVHYASRATMCTIARDPSGYPFGSVVVYLSDGSGSPWVLISQMAEHTQNAQHDPRASVLVAENAAAGTDPLSLARVSLIGELVNIHPPDELRVEFLARHPSARFYVEFPDFSWWRLEVRALRYVGGFGRMSWVGASDYATATPDPLTPHAAGICAHMNADHAEAQADLLRHYLDRPDISTATMTGVDRLGCDFDTTSPSGNLPLRLAFPVEATSGEAVRSTLVAMLSTLRAVGQ